MTVVIILLGLALAVSLAFNLGFLGGKAGASTRSPAAPRATASLVGRDDERLKKLELELEKKRKDAEELKKSQADLKEELKATKKKVFEQREAERSGDDLARARAEVERQASIQLEATRAELSTALAEVQRLKAGPDERNRRRPAGPVRTEEKPAPVERPPERQEVVQRVIRELSDVERERIARLELQSSNDRKKATELEREVRALRGKIDRIHRESKRVYGDANLARDKFRAVELRLNRTLLESDLLRRAVFELEKKTGQQAEHTSLTPEEVAASDRSISEKHAAEDVAEAEARAKLEAAAPTTGEDPASVVEVPAAPEASEVPGPEATATA